MIRRRLLPVVRSAFAAVVLAAAASGAARADLPASFAALAKQTKGPFGLNVLQGSAERVSVSSGRIPAGFLFQAAYRNALAESMIADYSFRVGNLFTVNYYELMGEFVFGDRSSSHPLDHAGLAARGSGAIEKAAAIVRDWVLEKYYVERFPASRLARSYKIRGVSGVEHETEYARYFFDFYLGAISSDFHYLPAFLLVTRSPVSDSASLARARTLVAIAYDQIVAVVGARDPMAAALYKIRNGVHNQLSPGLVGEIDAFLKAYPRYRTTFPPPSSDPGEPPAPAERKDLDEVRAILVEYYALGAAKLAKLAGKAGLADLKTAAERFGARGGATTANLMALSAVAADVRARIGDPARVAPGRRAEAFSLLWSASRFLKREIVARAPKFGRAGSDAADRALAIAAIDAIYVEGFLIADNWRYFRAQAKSSGDLRTVLRNAVEVAGGDTLAEAFREELPRWISVEKRMGDFLDQTIKSSAVEAAAALVDSGRNRSRVGIRI